MPVIKTTREEHLKQQTQKTEEMRSKSVPEQDIENRFTYHKPNCDQAEIYPKIREKAKEFACLIKQFVPESREQALALTKLEETVMWANAGISRN